MGSEGEAIINQPEVKSVEEKIKDRFEQENLDRMVEYVTGLHLNDPELLDRMGEDQIRVREKYGLPSRDYKFANPAEYERYLRELAEVNGIKIKSKSDCGKFFKQNSSAKAVYSDQDKFIGIDIEKTDMAKYLEGVTSLEHETIHSLQDKHYPGMPIEIMEYEAYVANWDIDYLRSNDAVAMIFGYNVGGSVNQWYRERNEKFNENITPVWKNPEYFLKNIDGVSEEAIQKYKTEHQIDTEK